MISHIKKVKKVRLWEKQGSWKGMMVCYFYGGSILYNFLKNMGIKAIK